MCAYGLPAYRHCPTKSTGLSYSYGRIDYNNFCNRSVFAVLQSIYDLRKLEGNSSFDRASLLMAFNTDLHVFIPAYRHCPTKSTGLSYSYGRIDYNNFCNRSVFAVLQSIYDLRKLEGNSSFDRASLLMAFNTDLHVFIYSFNFDITNVFV
ncbi:hypothetical protein QE152_g24938 [Popillia japonica]|uniref:Uncharacterized protein n=1 Tax=Popillia japonica TaxID=7064 RepID=A0AAW1K329_POPJA